MSKSLLTKDQKKVITAIAFGNILEWYDIYAFVFLTPILAKEFFGFESYIASITSAFVVFGLGAVSRILGGWFFGNSGDHTSGRKETFQFSILITTLATVLTGCLPTFNSWGVFAPISLILLRMIQSFGAAGEFPGAICFLYENSHSGNARFMTSWVGVGNQLGTIVALIEMFIFDTFASEEFLFSWGWRISFWYGGVIGIIGFILRNRLHETIPFERLKIENKLDKETELQLVKNHIIPIIQGLGFGMVNASTYYILATYVPVYVETILGISTSSRVIVSLGFVIITTVCLPLVGIMGDRVRNKPILVYSAIACILLVFPLSYAINTKSLMLLLLVSILYIIPITLISGLLAFRLAHLFHTAVRYSGVAFSWNIADGLFGGFAPALAILLFRVTGMDGAFGIYILITAIVSLFAYSRIRE